jgi:PTS system mannose-specific IIA component
MIGMVLVTHGRLATEFIAALEHVVGPQQRIAAVCIGADDDMEARRRDILDSIKKVDEGDGVVLLTDMFGGTPSNLAISVLDRANVEVIASINLPCSSSWPRCAIRPNSGRSRPRRTPAAYINVASSSRRPQLTEEALAARSTEAQSAEVSQRTHDRSPQAGYRICWGCILPLRSSVALCLCGSRPQTRRGGIKAL